MRFKEHLLIACLWLPLLLLMVIPATCQTVSPRQILPATAQRVLRPDLKYKLQSDPLNGGKFWYVVDTPSVSGGGSDVVPNWQQVTDVGKTTTHFVTASGLTLTQLTTGNETDSIIVVRNGILKTLARQIIPAPAVCAPVQPVADPFDPQPIVWKAVNIPPQYQVPNLRYIVFRNGIEQRLNEDYTVNLGQFLVFNLPFYPKNNAPPRVTVYAYGFN